MRHPNGFGDASNRSLRACTGAWLCLSEHAEFVWAPGNDAGAGRDAVGQAVSSPSYRVAADLGFCRVVWGLFLAEGERGQDLRSLTVAARFWWSRLGSGGSVSVTTTARPCGSAVRRGEAGIAAGVANIAIKAKLAKQRACIQENQADPLSRSPPLSP
jgi:hypothetical protein